MIKINVSNKNYEHNYVKCLPPARRILDGIPARRSRARPPGARVSRAPTAGSRSGGPPARTARSSSRLALSRTSCRQIEPGRGNKCNI